MGAITTYFKDFGVLKETHKAFWGLQTINVLDATFEFAFSIIITIFLSKTIGFTDQEAGYAITIVGVVSSITFFFIGPFVDWLGIRKAIFIGLVAMFIFRSGLVYCAFTPDIPYRGVVTLVMIFLSGVPAAMLGTIYQIGNRRYTTERSQAAGFNIWYIAMNIGAIASGLLVDYIHKTLSLPFEWVLVFGLGTTIITIFVALITVTTNEQLVGKDEEQCAHKYIELEILNQKEKDYLDKLRRLVMFGTLGSLLAFAPIAILIIYHYLPNFAFDARLAIAIWIGVSLMISFGYTLAIKHRILNKKRCARNEALLKVPVISEASNTEEKKSKGLKEGLAYAKNVIIAPAFVRMLAALTLLVGVRAAFLYTGLLMPKYWYRVIGEGAQVGWLNTINPVIIVLGVLLLVPIINRYDTYKMLVWGALLAAMCFVPLAVPWYYISDNIVVAYYIMAVASMIFLSFGEMMWSPRLSHYIVSVAPSGQEGTYSAFASLPWFVAKTIAGGLSGVMLAKWCPEFIVQGGVNVPIQKVLITQTLPYWQTPEALWLILGIIAIIGPIIMLFLKDWFTVGMKQKV
ncbi:MAG: MFS transporter [Candidatus Paceibacterota bacterium]|jgi:MFS family permease|nr:MFS transporter [Candidatus Paceibacterota bacterium]